MRRFLAVVLIMFSLFGCQAKKEADKEVPENYADDKNVQQVYKQLDFNEKSDIAELVYQSEEQEKKDSTQDILVKYGRLLSGSWARYPDKVDSERELSWGIVPFASQRYTLIDFIAEKPLFINGPREDGSIGKDSMVAEVEKIEIESPETFRVYYMDHSLGSKSHYGNFSFRYNAQNDTISIIDLGGAPFIKPSIQERVSQRLPE